MGRDFHAYLEKYNHDTHHWEAIRLFKLQKNSFKEIPFIDWGWGDSMDILTESHSPFPTLDGIHAIEKDTLSPEVKDHYQKLFEIVDDNEQLSIGYFGLHMINLADIKIYTLLHPIVPDYDATWPEEATSGEDPAVPKTKNPLTDLLESAIQYITFCDDLAFCFDCLSDYRMIYWGDC